MMTAVVTIMIWWDRKYCTAYSLPHKLTIAYDLPSLCRYNVVFPKSQKSQENRNIR